MKKFTQNSDYKLVIHETFSPQKIYHLATVAIHIHTNIKQYKCK